MAFEVTKLHSLDLSMDACTEWDGMHPKKLTKLLSLTHSAPAAKLVESSKSP